MILDLCINHQTSDDITAYIMFGFSSLGSITIILSSLSCWHWYNMYTATTNKND
ncbi:hypothetical protein J6A31_06405 [bacterium]|nr:hypothetical protein [bacterium]